jgi:hypothetical protein
MPGSDYPKTIDTLHNLIEDRACQGGFAMNNARLVGVTLGTLAIGGWRMTAQNTITGGLTELQITIYDQAHISRDVTQSVSDQLRLIFRQAGISINLIEGDSAADEASLFTYTGLPQTGYEQEFACRARRDIALKIVGASPAGLQETVFGMASPLARLGLNVRIFDDHIRQASVQRNRPHANLLSCAIAHEIGHVLLRGKPHGKEGLMSAVWSGHEYEEIAVEGVMFFTPDESRGMLMSLRGMGCRGVQPRNAATAWCPEAANATSTR